MLASWFVARGIDAVRHPTTHVATTTPALRPLVARAEHVTHTELTRYLDGPTMTRVVQVHGAATALAGFALVFGKAPRTAALTLAALTAPLLIANLPARVKGETPEDRKARRDRLMQALTATGGAILAGGDREGRPGIAWRVEHAREARAKAREATQD